jgi:hypothetical protein
MTYQSVPQSAGLDRPSAGLSRSLTSENTRHAFNTVKSARRSRRENKLDALVQLDVEGSNARIKIRGSVDTRNVKALYILAKRANCIAPGADIVLDLHRSTVQPEAMEMLEQCAQARQLPPRVDPMQSECRLHVTPAAKLARTSVGLTLTA